MSIGVASRCRFPRRLVGALAAALLLPAATGTSQTAGVPGTQNPAAAAPGSPAAQATPIPGTAPPDQGAVPVTTVGLCQCIANFKDLQFSCPGSADDCHSQCGDRYSFVPMTQCPVTPR
jgi:hypothetical protein